MRFSRITKKQFVLNIPDTKEDKFAKTFVAKANMGGSKYWNYCTGIKNNDYKLMGAVIVTVSVRKPHVANLQLLHTFSQYRNQGVGRALVEYAIGDAIRRGAEYLRVSSEIPAIEFYKKLGFKMLGRQKSGCELSMFKINGPKITDGIFDLEDPVITKAVYTKARGGCVEVFEEIGDGSTVSGNKDR